jgi:outer membrane protein OmpA-like peptidoglycan-associated protein
MRRWLAVATWAALVATAAGVGRAQETVRVTVGGVDMVVVREGDQLRLGPGGVVTVSDWRSAKPRVAIGDASAILVDLGASEEGGRMRLHLSGDVLFDFDSSAIRADAAVELAKVAEVVRQRSVGRVEVTGHTDSVGADAYNQRLSEARALAVVRWLNAEEGIPAEVMVAWGMGPRQPVAPNTMPDGSDSPGGRARNRRVEVQFATTEAAARVAVGGSAIQVSDAGVSVGGGAIRVDGSGVQVGGAASPATKGAQASSARAESTDDRGGLVCRAGETCSSSCEQGDCVMTCEPSADCTFSCEGGDCRMVCNPGAVCSFSCAGGDCRFTCPADSACRTSCAGGDCVCSGPGC